MILLIDGYNVIKQVHDEKQVAHEQRDAFVAKIAGYLKKRGLIGVIAFDGGQAPYPYKSTSGCVTVIFSGYKQTADDVIKKYLDEHKNDEILLVSSDHELRVHAHVLGKETINAYEFYKRYVQQPEQPEPGHVQTPLVKISADAPSELDALMEESTRQLSHKPNDGQVVRRPQAEKLSKKERKRERLLDKLK